MMQKWMITMDTTDKTVCSLLWVHVNVPDGEIGRVVHCS